MRIPQGLKYLAPLLLALMVLPSPGAPFLEAATNDVDSLGFVPGELIIQVNPTKNLSLLASDFVSINLIPKRLLSGRMNIWLYEYNTAGLKAAADHEQILADVRRHPVVELGQFNHYIQMRTTFPNDPSFSSQWGLHNTGQTGGIIDADIDAPEAWDLTTSGTTADGDQIVVAIIDGGCDLNHTDISFFKNIHDPVGNGIDDDGNGYIDDYHGWDAYANDGTIPGDDHGTHVAGIAAARGNNSTGVSGVNWNVKVMPIAGSSGQEAIAVAAYGYALEMRAQYNESDGAFGAFVVSTNASFGVDYGDPADYPIWCATYDSLGAYGILNAGATANIGMNIDTNGDIPTACPSDFLISVTNTTSSDARNTGAAYGLTTIDLGAPGTSIYSTLQGGGYGNKTGTSMATPHVAGAVGFMYSVASPEVIALAKTNPDSVALLFKNAILDGTDPVTSLNGITVTGGRLNLHNAALLVQAIQTGLNIAHNPLPNTRDTVNDYVVSATITSDTTLISDSLLLHFEVNSIWTSVPLTPGLAPDEYAADIPAQSPGTIINYYLTAADDAGEADTTETFSFHVIDYDVALRPDAITQTGLVNDTMWFDFRAVNIGLLDDEYTLAVVTSKWPTVIFDATGTTPITATGTIPPDDSLPFKVRVIIPPSTYLAADTGFIRAASVAQPSLTVTVEARTISNGPALDIPFADNFPDIIIDADLWASISGAQAGDRALNEPSPPYSLNLNGNPGGADQIISYAINLAGQTSILVRYQYERTGTGDSPEPGDDLLVEYLDSTGVWQTIAQHLGSGPDMTSFEEIAIPLPENAFHRQFRVRFRCIATTGAFDDWFVDDLFIGNPPNLDVSVTPPFSRQYGVSGEPVDYYLTVLNKGLGTDRYDLYGENLGGWPVSIYDSTGTAPITYTPYITGGDSTRFIARVTVPLGALTNDSSSSRVRVVSSNNANVSDTADIRTISSGAAGGFPWFENFPEDTLLTVRWPANAGAQVSSAALNPPSPPYMLLLDGDVDTIVSQVLDLSAAVEPMLTFYYQRGLNDPPEAGEDLWLEYKNAQGQWIELHRLLGGSSGMSWFTQQVVPLPAGALYNGFQLRLRSLGSCASCDLWYVDDISIDHSPDISVIPASIDLTLEQGETTSVDIIVQNNGLGELDYQINRLPGGSRVPFARLMEIGSLEPARRLYAEGFESYEDVKGADDTRVGSPVTRDGGGPDNYGYFWIDSDEPSGPAFEWIDITTIGTNIIGSLNDDSFAGPFSIGFGFPYYDSSYSQIFVGSNGIVGFAAAAMSSRFKKSIPNDTTPNAILAWLWDDMNPDDAANPGAAIYIDASPDRCVIQVVNYPEYLASAGDVINAEVVLYPDGSIRFQYLSIAPGFDVASGTVGIENATGTDGLEVAYLTPYLKDSLAILFTNPYQWLALGVTSGSIAPGMADTIPAMITAAVLDSGQFVVDLIFSSNDPNENLVSVPVSLTVTLPPQFICGDVSGDGVGPNVGDLTYLVNYLFRGGPPPPVAAAADVDGSGSLSVADLTFIVNYLFKAGPPPTCGG